MLVFTVFKVLNFFNCSLNFLLEFSRLYCSVINVQTFSLHLSSEATAKFILLLCFCFVNNFFHFLFFYSVSQVPTCKSLSLLYFTVNTFFNFFLLLFYFLPLPFLLPLLLALLLLYFLFVLHG